MPSLRHDVLVELFRAAPELARELAARSLGVQLPAGRARLGSIDLSAVAPASYFADVVVHLCGADDRPEAAVIVEVQLGRDPRKRRSWCSYVATEHARSGCDTYLLVVAPSRALARWCARPIRMGHPGLVLRPLVVHPGLVPRIVDPSQAKELPELAVLSTIAHAGEPDAAEIAWAAIEGSRGLEEERGKMYQDLVMTAVSAAARRALESWMREGYMFQCDFVQKWIAIGKKEGSRESLSRAVLRLVEARLGETPDWLETALAKVTTSKRLEALLVAIGAAHGAQGVRSTLDRRLRRS